MLTVSIAKLPKPKRDEEHDEDLSAGDAKSDVPLPQTLVRISLAQEHSQS